jgi:hypothetical protein
LCVSFEQYAIARNLVLIPEAVQFVGREKKLPKMLELLNGRSRRSAVVLIGFEK